MIEPSLIRFKDFIEDLIFKEIKSPKRDHRVIFYIGLIGSKFYTDSLLYKMIADDAQRLLKNIENGLIELNDTVAVSALLALHLVKGNYDKVMEKINIYLSNRLSDFEYSPLNNAMSLFLISQCLAYLPPSIKDRILQKLNDLITISQSFENTCLINASYLTLSKDDKNIMEKLAKKIIQYEPKGMTLSQGIYALWFYEIFLSPYINSFDQAIRSQIQIWNKNLKKEIIPHLLNELLYKPIEASPDKDLTTPLPVSAFELSLIYDTILKNKDKFLIISQQDFTNSIIEKSKSIYLQKNKWQNYFWVLLTIIFFTIPWYLLNIFNLRTLITAIAGILSMIFISFIRYKHIKQFLIDGHEWITDNYKNLFSRVFLGIIGAYIASFADLKDFFQPKLAEIYNISLIVIGVFAGILTSVIKPISNILKEIIFSVKLPDELTGSEDK